MVDSDIQNKLTAALAAIVGLLGFLAWIMPQIQDPVKQMAEQLPPEYQGPVMVIVLVVVIIVYVWNYTSSVQYGNDKKDEGIVQATTSESEKLE